MNIKIRFEKLSQKEIAQLYLIVLMTYGLIFIFYKELSSMIYPTKIYATTIVKVKKDNTNNIKRLTDLELHTYFNDNSKENKIDIKEMKILKNTIEIQIIGDFKNIMNFLNQASDNFTVKQFEIKKSNNKIDLSLQLKRESFYISQRSDLQTKQLVNPFILKRYKKNDKVSKIVISAIIDSEVLINNSWYKQDDRINEYLILSITKNKVILVDIKTKKKVIKSINHE